MEKNMKLSESVKPISYFKAHASEIIREIVNTRQPLEKTRVILLKITFMACPGLFTIRSWRYHIIFTREFR